MYRQDAPRGRMVGRSAGPLGPADLGCPRCDPTRASADKPRHTRKDPISAQKLPSPLTPLACAIVIAWPRVPVSESYAHASTLIRTPLRGDERAMKTRTVLALAVPVASLAVAALIAALAVRSTPPAPPGPGRPPGSMESFATGALPRGVTLRQIDGGPRYYAHISPGSAWMDQHIMVGAWLEQPLSAREVRDDVAMGNNIYWSLAGDPLDTKDCGGAPCRVNYNVIRAVGMHASAPDVTSRSGSETVAFEGTDEADLNFGPGYNGWNPRGTYNQSSCIPAGSRCGYTVARFFYRGRPASYGSPGYPIGKKPITQGFGAGVLFFDTNAQDAKFLTYSDTLSADSYWMTDQHLDLAAQGGCALLPSSAAACGSGNGLTDSQRALPANYSYDVTNLEQLQAMNGRSKPVTVDVETGCPGADGICTTPAASSAAAWHAIIAGARGIIWFQHNFSGPCVDFRAFYDGSNPSSPMYGCQQTPGVTLHDVVKRVSAFNHLVARLNSVLLSPFAEHYVRTGGADVSVMAKYSRGVFYVFAASGKPATPPRNNLSVTFRVAGGYTGPVTVIGERRTLHAVNGVFTDTFANADSVHIYRIGR